jgi:hypothetical protein
LWIAMTIIWMAAVMAFEGKEPFEVLWTAKQWKIHHDQTGVTVVVDSTQSPESIRAHMADAAKRVAALLEQQGDHAGAKAQLESLGDDKADDDLIKVVQDWRTDPVDRLRGALSLLLTPPAGLRCSAL